MPDAKQVAEVRSPRGLYALLDDFTELMGFINSTLPYYVNAGSSYMICVDGTSSDAGYGIINLDFKLDASPGNDNWAKPTPITFQTNIVTIGLPNGTATNTLVGAITTTVNGVGTTSWAT